MRHDTATRYATKLNCQLKELRTPRLTTYTPPSNYRVAVWYLLDCIDVRTEVLKPWPLGVIRHVEPYIYGLVFVVAEFAQ
jgi:hypothetical protein